MTDKEVGKLWRAWKDTHTFAAVPIVALIRKLVEERYERSKVSLNDILVEFGIDPETWGIKE